MISSSWHSSSQWTGYIWQPVNILYSRFMCYQQEKWASLRMYKNCLVQFASSSGLYLIDGDVNAGSDNCIADCCIWSCTATDQSWYPSPISNNGRMSIRTATQCHGRKWAGPNGMNHILLLHHVDGQVCVHYSPVGHMAPGHTQGSSQASRHCDALSNVPLGNLGFCQSVSMLLQHVTQS